MAEPVTWFTAAAAIAAITTAGITAYSANEQAAAQRAAADYNEKLAKQNQELQNQQADAEQRQSIEKARRIREQRDRLLGLQRSQFAAAGVAEQGSPLAVLADTYTQGELAATDELARGAEAARIRRTSAMWNTSAESAGARIARREAQITQLGGYGAIADGVGNLASIGRKSGAFDGDGGGDGGGGTNLRGEFQYATGTVPKATAVR